MESVVQLQENDSCLMSFAQKCLFTNDQIVFWEYKAKKIYTFSYDGKFRRQIGRMGHSASEYTNIDDVCMSGNDSVMMLLDNRGVVCYDVNSGKFVGRKKLFSQKFGEYQRIAPVGNSEFLCSTYSETPSSIVLDCPKGQVGLREGKRFHLGTDCFYKYKDNYRVISDYGDFYIDSYEDGKLKTLYKIIWEHRLFLKMCFQRHRKNSTRHITAQNTSSVYHMLMKLTAGCFYDLLDQIKNITQCLLTSATAHTHLAGKHH